jgi:dipeptidyl aminopeptidase/acylaminoacyl peptidase
VFERIFGITSPTFYCTLLIGLAANGAFAQNGTLIQSSPVTLSDEGVKRLEKNRPDIRTVLDLVEVKWIAYLSDGLKVMGYLAAPKNGTALPCIICNRGGNQDFGSLTDISAAALLGPIASWGYVIVASQYRGNAGGEGKEEFGGSDLNDVLNLLPLLDSLPQADPRRVGIYGSSRGGMMTYLALAKTERFAAAIVVSGLADLSDTAERRPEMASVFAKLIPGYDRDRSGVLAVRSAVQWPEKLYKKTPILLIHGSSDWRVHPSQALAMASKLYQTRHPFRFVFLEGADHSLGQYRGEVERLVKEWLDGYVRDSKAWPSLDPHGR